MSDSEILRRALRRPRGAAGASPLLRLVPWAILALVALVAAAGRGCNLVRPPNSTENLPAMEVYFSPRGGCTEAVVAEIDRTRSSILVQAYSFTSAPIAEALVEAHRRGVQVSVVLDRSQESEKYSSADFLLHAGIATLVDEHHAIAHNKVMVLDSQTVITGSFNFTKAAEENNAENLLVIRDERIAELYIRNWRAHAEHSVEYTGRKAPTEDAPPAKKAKAASHRTKT
jgi:phosphatidylserine/phosphatidylglycerophosphate/cardiolipin synthase-like enzyme